MSPSGTGLRHEPEVGVRDRAEWPGLALETHAIAELRPRGFSLRQRALFLCLAEQGTRRDGVVDLEGAASPFREVVGRMHVVPPGCGFSGWLDPSGPHRFRYVHLDTDAAFLRPVEMVGAALAPRAGFRDAGLAATIRKLAEAASDPRRGRLAAEALGLLLAIELLRRHGAPPRPPPGGGLAPRQLRRAQERLRAGMEGGAGLAEVADAVGLSPWHFCRAFRASTGDPPQRWLAHRRIDTACDLLRDPRRSVLEVALAVGFGGASQFARAFRRATGASPSAWRREAQG
jgi:AraC family transcriptional regulator